MSGQSLTLLEAEVVEPYFMVAHSMAEAEPVVAAEQEKINRATAATPPKDLLVVTASPMVAVVAAEES